MRKLLTHVRALHELRFFKFATMASFVLLALGVAGIFWQLYPAVVKQPVVPLHYTIHFGVDQVGPGWRLFVPSILAFVLTIANLLFAGHMWQREKVIAYAFIVTSLFVNLFTLLHIVFIVLLNLTYV